MVFLDYNISHCVKILLQKKMVKITEIHFVLDAFHLSLVYRITIFNRLRTLISLDGMDKHGKKDLNSQGLTGNSIDKRFLIYTVFSKGIEQYVGLTNETREQLVGE